MTIIFVLPTWAPHAPCTPSCTLLLLLPLLEACSFGHTYAASVAHLLSYASQPEHVGQRWHAMIWIALRISEAGSMLCSAEVRASLT